VCIDGAQANLEVAESFVNAIYAALFATHGLLDARCDLLFKGVMGDEFKMWTALHNGGVLSKDCGEALQVLQLSAMANLAKIGGGGNKGSHGQHDQNKTDQSGHGYNKPYNNNNNNSYNKYKKMDGRGAGPSAATN
jgi:hypothetical protein